MGELLPSEQIDETPFARQIWDHFVQQAPVGLLRAVDRWALESLCIHLALAQRISVQFRDEGGYALDGKAVKAFMRARDKQVALASKLQQDLALTSAGLRRLGFAPRH